MLNLTAALARQLFLTKTHNDVTPTYSALYLCSILARFFLLRPHSTALFEILMTSHMYRMPPHSHCEFATLFLSSCSFVSFKLPHRPRKEGKQRHLFTPLLSRRDLEGGSVLRHSDSFLNGPRFTPVHSQLVRGVLRLCVCVCDGKADDGELFKASRSVNMKRFEEGELHFIISSVMAACVECVVVLQRLSPGSCPDSGNTFSRAADGRNPITLHG